MSRNVKHFVFIYRRLKYIYLFLLSWNKWMLLGVPLKQIVSYNQFINRLQEGRSKKLLQFKKHMLILQNVMILIRSLSNQYANWDLTIFMLQHWFFPHQKSLWFVAIHLSHILFHCSKHPWCRLLSFFIVSYFVVSTSSQRCPFIIFLHIGNRKSHRARELLHNKDDH